MGVPCDGLLSHLLVLYKVYYTTPVHVIVDYCTVWPFDSRQLHGDVTILISSKKCCIKQIINGFIRATVEIFHLLKDWTCSIQLSFAWLNRTFQFFIRFNGTNIYIG